MYANTLMATNSTFILFICLFEYAHPLQHTSIFTVEEELKYCLPNHVHFERILIPQSPCFGMQIIIFIPGEIGYDDAM
jgi:hypothetical protein